MLGALQRASGIVEGTNYMGALSAGTKELLGLVASAVLRCNDCIFYHIDRCVTEGATREEIMEAMNIALVIGGSIVIPHLRYGFEMLDTLLTEAAEEKAE